MKFPTAALLGVFSLALSFTPTFVQACERECQVNVSRAFADKYQIVSGDYFTLLNSKVEKSLFYGVPVNDLLSSVETNNAIKLIQESVVKAQNAWDVTIFQTVFDTIFKDEPKFKGDCNHPYRVKQPPLGVNWTMPDCHNMDYICGNPPSICHFMPMIKTRIVKKLMMQLQARVDGDDSDVYINYIGLALQTLLTQQPKLQTYSATLHGNLNQVLEELKQDLIQFANEGQWKKEWDMEIKILLLTFP
ncbi:hypothetical protein BX616_010156 [Lobosporangium transversale]|uniref:Uncharacterized protein n=1 Tax=Lobosporangium transversale TaxID=64571 RepID=A0A1Y2G7Z1_9FUNG|nr:hypothetical protein BCR41DRAFT_364637 [Lobosporangium transversale]KAF9913209.1 hypothetical protein BX616_010156 [Lobosporangium transversale]ORY97091.1 hypothetical protein BCR41DRAFT_364637 [Lobosporangium transversale]|eukprot:XP_021875624.1 hypothetical protein BCR41DRAFT_364637 [Lobosporangium transversale]